MSEIGPKITIAEDDRTGVERSATTLPPNSLATPNLKSVLVAAAGSTRRADIIGMLGRPVSWCVVRHWLSGRRPMPEWAIIAVRDRLSRLEAILATRRAQDRGEAGTRALMAYMATKKGSTRS